MLAEEQVTSVDPRYMDSHSKVATGGKDPDGIARWLTPGMRFITVGWMSELAVDLVLSQKTLSMAVLLMDRYLSRTRCFPRTNLQLAAASSLFIACKIEGNQPHPRASSISRMSDGAFDRQTLVDFERVMCQTLDFEVYAPTAQNFLCVFMQALPMASSAPARAFASRVRELASYFIEICSLVYKVLEQRRSVLASSALVLALADSGVQKALADEIRVPAASLSVHSNLIISRIRLHVGPWVRADEVAATAKGVARLHTKIAKTSEFTVQKFSTTCRYRVARVASTCDGDELDNAIRVYMLGS